MAAKTDSIEREIEHSTDSDGAVPAVLAEEREDQVQLQQIQRMTVEPGLMRLPVASVDTAENSENFSITLDHPVEGELTMFVEKPTHGWSDEYKLVRMLKWYGITNENPHELQTRSIYVAHDPDNADRAHDWMIVAPPDYERPTPPIRERVRGRVGGLRPTGSNARLFGFQLVGAVSGGLLATVMPAVPFVSGVLVSALTVLVVFVCVTIIGMAVLNWET